MPQFRKKPVVVVEAVRFNGSNQAEVLRFAFPGMSAETATSAQIMRLPVVIVTPEGEVTAGPGDWIVRAADGEVHRCKPGIFAATYEAV